MQYFGAADYYFWQGVKDGCIASPKQLRGEFELGFSANNQTTKACIDSYHWGFFLGIILTHEEYVELTTEPDLRDNTKTETEEPALETTVGNC